jgi:hypothetical protein
MRAKSACFARKFLLNKKEAAKDLVLGGFLDESYRIKIRDFL